MRRSALLFLCSIAPGGTVAGCFGTSTPAIPDGGINAPDTGLPSGDASFSHDSSVAEAGADGAEAAVDAPVDAPVDSPPSGTFPTTLVDFGLVDCGSAPTGPKTYSFTNTGPVPVTYSASVGTGTIFGIQGASSGTVAPGGTGSLTLTVGTVPATSTAGTAITGTLTLTTDVPDETLVSVPLQVTPQGGSLTLTPATAGFNTVQLSTLAPAIPLTLTNVGNAPVGVSLGTPTDPQFTVTYTGGPGTVTVAAGAALPGASADFTPSAAGLQQATSAIQTTGVMCASPATSLALNGTGTTASVTAGPSPLDFGTVSCGAQSAQNPTVTVSNGYTFAIDYSTTFAAGSTLYSANPATGSVPAQGTATFTVTAKPIPSAASVTTGAFDDTLTVNTTAPGSPSSTIALQESAQGAILGLTMANTGFAPVVAGSTGTLPFTVTNTGNVSAPITLLPSGTGYGGVFTGSSTAAGPGSIGGNATYTPQAAGTVDGSLGISSSVVLCAPLPPAISLTATGVGPVATYPGTTLDLSVTCGGSASNETSLTITNSTAYPLTVDASSESGLFTVVAPANITIPANSSGSISIQAPAVATGSKASGTYADHLLFQTNEFGNPTHSVPVSIAVNGANLSFTAVPPDPITGCLAQEAFTVTNSGNGSATITEPTTGTGAVSFLSFVVGVPAPVYTATVDASGGTVTGHLVVNATCQEPENGTYTFTTSGAVCEGSPLQLPVTWDIAEPCNSCC